MDGWTDGQMDRWMTDRRNLLQEDEMKPRAKMDCELEICPSNLNWRRKNNKTHIPPKSPGAVIMECALGN